jgi:hypothetical protein
MPFQSDANTEMTVRIWSNMGRAMKKGASWGDLAVYDRIEMDEVLAARQNRGVIPVCPVSSAITEPIYIERSAPCAPPCESEKLPTQAMAIKPKQKQAMAIKSKQTQAKQTYKHFTRPVCIECFTFLVHSKPTDRWSTGDRKSYCCLGCRDSAGKKHSDQCQKHK